MYTVSLRGGREVGRNVGRNRSWRRNVLRQDFSQILFGSNIALYCVQQQVLLVGVVLALPVPPFFPCGGSPFPVLVRVSGSRVR